MSLLPTEQRRVALPLRQHDHHERRADPDGFAGREPSRVGHLPIAAGLTPDLDLQLHVFAVVEQALAAAASARVAAENFVQGLLDGDLGLPEQALNAPLSKGAQHLFHLLDGVNADADAANAPEADTVEV